MPHVHQALDLRFRDIDVGHAGGRINTITLEDRDVAVHLLEDGRAEQIHEAVLLPPERAARHQHIDVRIAGSSSRATRSPLVNTVTSCKAVLAAGERAVAAAVVQHRDHPVWPLSTRTLAARAIDSFSATRLSRACSYGASRLEVVR